MRRVAIPYGALGIIVMVAGCSPPAGSRMASIPVFIEGGIVRPGDTLPLKAGPGVGSGVTLTITNTATQASVSRLIPKAEIDSTVLRVDPADLPGLDLKGADLQTFSLRIEDGESRSETGVTVLFDKTALMPPSVPLGKAPIIGNVAGGTQDTEELAASVVAAWEGTTRCATSRVVNVADLSLHPNVRQRIPDGTPLREFTVRGEFPRRLVQAPWTPPGVEIAVVTPRALRFVIAETAPSHLVTLQALEAGDVVQEACP